MPPDTPTQPPDDAEPSASESGGPVEQSELDALIAAFEEGEKRAQESPKPTQSEASDPPAEPVRETKAPTPSTPAEDQETSVASGLVEQSELDALIAAFEDKERRAREGDSPSGEEPPRPAESKSDAGESAVASTFEAASSGSVSQSDIETLIQQATQVADEESDGEVEDIAEAMDAPAESESEPAESVEPEDATPESSAPAGEMDDALEELLSAAESGDADEPETQDWPKPPPKPPEPKEESDLVKAASGELDASTIADLEQPDEAIGGEMDDALADASEPDDVLAETSAAEEAPEELSQAQLDELLAAAQGDEDNAIETGVEPESGEAETVGATVPEPETAAETAEAALEATTVPAEVMEEVGSENVAAGAVDEGMPSGDSSSGAPAPTGASKPSAVDAPRPETKPERPVWLPPSLVELFREEPVRASAALAAGLLVALSTVVLLMQNQFRMPDPDELAFSAPGALNRAVLLANELLADNRPEEALTLLDRALASAEEFDEGYDDARFARIEAMLASLPTTLSSNRAAEVHAAIDDVVETARAHPRAAEALLWKGQVYEREGNPIAARAEYRGILDNFAASDIRDDVLLELAEIELATGRPILATDFLQEIISDYPNSPHHERARLLLGDAYAAAGDSDLARGTYIRLAEEQMDSAVGGEAFERLGKLAMDEGDLRGAIRELESRLESATTIKGHDRVNLTLARAYRGVGDYEKARNVLNGLIDFFPESDIMPLALAELSQVLADLGEMTEAVRLATRAAERFPESPEVLENAGDLLTRTDEPGAAAGYILAAYEAGAREPTVLLAAADRFRDAGALDDAQEAYDRVIVEFPTTLQAIEATVGWAEAAQAKGEVSEAYDRLQKLARATEGRPRQLPVLRALGRLYRDLGLETDAINAFTQVTAITDDPEALAEASIELMRAGAIDEGLAVAERVETAKLGEKRAYTFLTTQGEMLLRVRPSRAVDVLLQAHEDYPDARSSDGVTQLLDALLTLGRSAQARAVIADMDARVQQPEHAHERPLLNRSAAAYGDFLYERGDYRAAIQAYATALGARPGEEPPAIVSTAGLSETQLWSLYQRANAFAALDEHDKSLELFEQIATTGSPLAKDAEARAAAVRMEQRMRGDTSPSDRRAT